MKKNKYSFCPDCKVKKYNHNLKWCINCGKTKYGKYVEPVYIAPKKVKQSKKDFVITEEVKKIMEELPF